MTATRTGCSPHLLAELEAMRQLGRPLERGEFPPDCTCWRCTGKMPAPRHDADNGAVTCPRCGHYRELVRNATHVWYACSACGTFSKRRWRIDVGMWSIPFPVGTRRRRRKVPHRAKQVASLNVDGARAFPVSDVARRYGLELNRGGWTRCPFHDDSHPSLHVNDRKRAAFCNVCGRSWDAIALTMALGNISFVDAVRELAP